MIDNIVDKIVVQMISENIIDDVSSEKYRYTIVSMFESLITIGTILIIGQLARKFGYMLVFCIFFFSLRRRCGGFHLNSFLKCYFASVLTSLVIMQITKVFADYIGLELFMMTVAFLVIEIIGTVNHPNIHMNQQELANSKGIARILAAIECVIIYVTAYLKLNSELIAYMTVALVLCALLMVIAKVCGQDMKV